MQFLYFLKDAPAQVDLAEWGLSYVSSHSKQISKRQVQAPHMGNGLLVTRGDVDICRIDPTGQGQVWHKMPAKFVGEREVWCGWWLDKVPNAESLARKQIVPGDELAFVDGQKWTVPVLRKFVESDRPWPVYEAQLPTVLDYDSDGNLTIGQVIPEYSKIWKKAIEVAGYLTNDAKKTGEINFSLIDMIDFAGELMSVNYYVSIFELVKLGAITQEIAGLIVRKALDFDGFKERLKNLASRSQSSGTNSQSGGDSSNEESTAITGQPLQT